MIGRILRAMRLDATLFEEVESREDLNIESWLLIGFIAVLNAFLFAIFSAFSFEGGLGYGFFSFVPLIIFFLVNFGITFSTIWFVGSKLFGGMASLGELRRAMSYAYAPYLFIAIPCINILVVLWVFASSFVAVRQSMDMSSGKTIVVIIIANIFAFIPISCIAFFGLSIFGALLS